VLVAALAGCGTRAHNEAVAQAKAWARTHDEPTDIHCSSGIGGIHPRTPDFICVVRHTAVDCDELRVTRTRGRWSVTLRRTGVDCVLPA
jgi:hypothetical protein